MASPFKPPPPPNVNLSPTGYSNRTLAPGISIDSPNYDISGLSAGSNVSLGGASPVAYNTPYDLLGTAAGQNAGLINQAMPGYGSGTLNKYNQGLLNQLGSQSLGQTATLTPPPPPMPVDTPASTPATTKWATATYPGAPNEGVQGIIDFAKQHLGYSPAGYTTQGNYPYFTPQQAQIIGANLGWTPPTSADWAPGSANFNPQPVQGSSPQATAAFQQTPGQPPQYTKADYWTDPNSPFFQGYTSSNPYWGVYGQDPSGVTLFNPEGQNIVGATPAQLQAASVPWGGTGALANAIPGHGGRPSADMLRALGIY